LVTVDLRVLRDGEREAVKPLGVLIGDFE